MAGQFTVEQKHELLKKITELIQSDGNGLLRIDIDDLGQRLQVKLNMVQHRDYYFSSSLKIHKCVMSETYIDIANQTNVCQKFILNHLHKNIRTIKQTVSKLMTFRDNGNRLQQAAFKFLAPFIFTTYGSILASSKIGENNEVSPESLVWLSAGLNSDISSSKLKLASVYYSTGDMKKSELILRQTEHQFYSNPVLTVCVCWEKPPPALTAEFQRICCEQSEDCIKHITSFCVRFIQEEINCVPYELQFEMFRSTHDDMIHRVSYMDFWMNWIVVDSLPFLYFLQYKIYSHLQKHQDQQEALSKLISTIITDENLKHRETALNILGQCMEQENRPQQAFKCYLLSRQERARNNAANFHICKLLYRILAGQ
jgi:tetratricopeptide (TPR) repeat protein